MEIWFFILGMVFGSVCAMGIISLVEKLPDEHEDEDNWGV